MKVDLRFPLPWCALGLMALAVSGRPLPAEDPWAPFNYLAGSWKAVGSGEAGPAAKGGLTFSFDLDKQILVRRNWVEYSPRPGEKTGVRHEDLLITYRQPGEDQFRAIYFDPEGHVIHYIVSFPSGRGAVTYSSDQSRPGPRYRLEYELEKEGRLQITFLIAPPGQAFKVYAKGVAEKEK